MDGEQALHKALPHTLLLCDVDDDVDDDDKVDDDDDDDDDEYHERIRLMKMKMTAVVTM